MAGLLHDDGVVVETKVDQPVPREGSVGTSHRHDLGLLGQQVDSSLLRLSSTETVKPGNAAFVLVLQESVGEVKRLVPLRDPGSLVPPLPHRRALVVRGPGVAESQEDLPQPRRNRPLDFLLVLHQGSDGGENGLEVVLLALPPNDDVERVVNGNVIADGVEVVLRAVERNPDVPLRPRGPVFDLDLTTVGGWRSMNTPTPALEIIISLHPFSPDVPRV